MAFYSFQLQSDLSTQGALDIIQKLARERPGFGQSLKESFGWRPEDNPPFIGKVEGNEFSFYRDIRGRNSFLPRIRGRVLAYRNGSRIEVNMYLHPLVILFMLFWLGGVGSAAASMLWRGKGTEALVPLGMFVFGLLMILGGFYPEAIKARRILEERIQREERERMGLGTR